MCVCLPIDKRPTRSIEYVGGIQIIYNIYKFYTRCNIVKVVVYAGALGFSTLSDKVSIAFWNIDKDNITRHRKLYIIENMCLPNEQYLSYLIYY